MNEKSLIRVFVAMPGTNMGESASWQNIDEIKMFFYEAIGDKLQQVMQCQVELVVEKDKVLQGNIHASMFKEAWDADVYIADLTGNNPNVYLELGVRWAVKDKVTVIVSQDVSSIKFNAASNRAIPYNKEHSTVKKAVDQVVKAITEEYHKEKYTDSPVRLTSEIRTIRVEKIKEYEDKIKQLEEENKLLRLTQGKNYLTAGLASEDAEFRINMFRKAIETNETLVDAYFYLGVELRKASRYQESILVLQKAISLNPNLASLYRELGIAYNKMERLEEASKSLKKALELDQGDGETWNNLGGVLRRLGMINAHNKYDWDTLLEARDSYKMAVELNQYDIYALGNVAKLDLMLSKIEASCKTAALDYFDTLRHLCPIQLKKSPNDYWIRFDLADAHLLSGNVSEGHHLYKEAMQKVPAAYRSSTFSSVISPLQNILFLDVVEEPINNVIKQLIEELTKASSQNIATTDGK